MTNPVPESPGRYTKKPVTIEAMQLNSDADDSRAIDWIEQSTGLKGGACLAEGGGIHVKTLEGTMLGGRGWWIIKGVDGEFYPCKHEIFLQTYAPDDGSGILVIPPGLLDELREAMYYPTRIQPKTTTISTDGRGNPPGSTMTVIVERTVEITAERVMAPLRTEPHILVQNGKPLG